MHPGVFEYLKLKLYMRKSRKRRILFIILAIPILAVFVFSILFLTAEDPPIASINMSQAAISQAKEAEAAQYVPRLLVAAETANQMAVDEWKYQNELISFNRDFSKMRALAQEATEKANFARESAIHVKDSLQTSLTGRLATVKNKLDHFNVNYAHLPLRSTTRQNFTSAKLRYTESKEAFSRGAYKDVGLNLDVASKLISKSVSEAHAYLSDYFRDLGKWQQWADETIGWTRRNNGYAIIIDKFAHKCYVYADGRVKKEFKAELGPHWIGTKQYRGDKATPEGRYHITAKKSKKQTKYYKALLINYPNDEDKARYEKNVKNGKIPRRGIGNLIEIHGDGGKGINWTDGCVALHNDDIDRLYEMVRVGTPVTIVGSLRSLKEINGF